MWLLAGNLSVVLCHRWFTVWYVYAGINTSSAVLGVGGDNFETFTINTASEGVPERVLDHPGKAVYWVLGQTRLVQNNPFPVMISGKSQFLK
jgi:hypothetical protein